MDQCRRVLHVLGGLNRGGAETMVMNLYRNMDRTEIQFDFVANEIDEGQSYQYYSEILSLGGHIYYAPKFSAKNLTRYRKWWKEFFEQHPNYIAVHGHHTVPGFIYLAEAKKKGIIGISHSHIAGGERTLRSLSKRFFRFPLRYIADYKFACSKSAARWMYGSEKEVIILNNAIDTRKFRFNAEIRKNKRLEFHFDEKEIVLGNIGRLTTQKNQQFLIKIFSLFHEKYPNSKLLIIGDGEHKNMLLKTGRTLGVDQSIIFAGIRKDIPELLQAMDVFVFPSLYEGLPVTVVEAQATGLPCLISNTVTTEVKVLETTKFLPINQGEEIWLHEIEEMVKKKFDREYGAEAVKNAQYDINDTAKWLAQFYFSLSNSTRKI